MDTIDSIFKLVGEIVVKNNEANSKIDETVKKAEDTEGKLTNRTKRLGSALTKIAKVGTAALSTIATGLTVMTKKAVANYAEYEQLVGGVETLFKTSSNKVLEYANNAYKTAGLSANQYMETVTSFSASLLQSLEGDTAKATEYANKAITDMADNSNKMGTSLSSIQYAYQGFAKQNYTMLDNLKLGYGGTKAEMERLIADANRAKVAMGEVGDLSIDSYADVVDAIHLIQNEMGITGTTAKEASETIQGSVMAMKGAWENWLTGMADPTQDFGALTDNLVDSVITVMNNIAPRLLETVPRIVEGLGSVIENLIPHIAPMLGKLIPIVIEGALNIANSLIKTIANILKSGASKVFASGAKLAVSLVKGIKTGVPKTAKEANNNVKVFVTTVAKNLGNIAKAGLNLATRFAKGIKSGSSKLLSTVKRLISSAIKTINTQIVRVVSSGKKLVKNLWNGIGSLSGWLVGRVRKLANSIPNAIKSSFAKVRSIGVYLVKGLWSGISSVKDWVLSKIKGFGSSILEGMRKIFDINSPSKKTEWQGEMLAMGLVEGIKKNTKHAKKSAEDMATVVLNSAKEKLKGLKETNRLSLADEVDYWNTIRRECKKGTEARKEADKLYLSSKKSLNEQLKKAEDDYLKKIEEVQQKIADRTKEILGQFNLFDEFKINIDEENPITADGLITNLQSQTNALNDWLTNIEIIKQKLGDTDLFRAIEQMGVDSLGQVTAIANMTDEQLARYQALYDERSKLAKKQAEKELEKSNAETLSKAYETWKTKAGELGVKIGDVNSSVVKDVAKAVSKVQTNINTGLNRIQNGLKSGAINLEKITDKTFKSISQRIASHMNSAVSAVMAAMAQMQSALSSAEEPSKKPSKKPTKKPSRKPKVSKHAEGGILTEPTIFGYSPLSDTYRLGGEAGAEAIVPIDKLQGYVTNAMNGDNKQVDLLEKTVQLLEALVNKNTNVYLNSKVISNQVSKDLGVIL